MIYIILSVLLVIVVIMIKYFDLKFRRLDKEIVRTTAYYNVLNQWVQNLHEKKFVTVYFIAKGYGTIAIYGCAEIGIRLLEELHNTKDVSVEYFVDRMPSYALESIKVYSPDENLPEVDVIVITPIHEYSSIFKMLKEKGTRAEIVSIEDVVYGLF